MVVFGHGGNIITRMRKAAKGIEGHDLLVAVELHTTT
jgi:hypothetical protein